MNDSPTDALQQMANRATADLLKMSEAELSHAEDELRLQMDLLRHARRMQRTARQINRLNRARAEGNPDAPDDEAPPEDFAPEEDDVW